MLVKGGPVRITGAPATNGHGLWRYIYNLILVIIICILGLIGNGVAFCPFGKLCNQNASTTLFRALAIVDSGLLLISLVSNANKLLLSGNLWLYLICIVYIIVPLNAIFRTATIWTPVLVGIHRYIVVCKPFQAARICTVGNARRHFIGVLLFSLVLNPPEFFRFHVMQVAVNATDHNVTCTAILTNMGSSPWFKIGYDKLCRTAIICLVGFCHREVFAIFTFLEASTNGNK